MPVAHLPSEPDFQLLSSRNANCLTFTHKKELTVSMLLGARWRHGAMEGKLGQILVFSVLVLTATLTAAVAADPVLALGPVVGGVTASGANVFVRTDQAASVAVRYTTRPDFNNYKTSASFTTDATSDFTKIIPLTDLAPEKIYYLDVVVNGVAQLGSAYPSFRTFAPAGSERNFKFVVLSDFSTIRNLTESSQTFFSAAAEDPAFAFIGGDFDHRDPKTIAARRVMYQQLYDPATPFMDGFTDLILRKMAVMHQWDDHDTGGNNTDRKYPRWSQSQQVFDEYFPSYPLSAVTPGIWQKFSYAQVDGFILDCRSQRDSNFDPDDSAKSMLDGNGLGATGQLQWLEDSLLASSARWKIIFSSVVANPSTKFPDGWAGYQTEWNTLKGFISTNQITGVVIVSGDLHLGAIDDGTESGFPEMCVSQPNGLGGCPTAAYGRWSEGYYKDHTCRSFGLVDVATNPDRLTLQVADEFGSTKLSYTVVSSQ
jgi:alkaline phosphatase D